MVSRRMAAPGTGPGRRKSQHGYDMGDRPDRGRRWNLDGGEHGDGGRAGVSHILDMQIEFDDTALAAPHNIIVQWTPTDDDFQPKPPEIFQRGVNFARQALDEEGTKLLVHCAAGVHRAPMMTLAILCSLSWNMKDAMKLIGAKRPVVDFADVYVRSVEKFLEQHARAVK